MYVGIGIYLIYTNNTNCGKYFVIITSFVFIYRESKYRYIVSFNR